MSIASILVTNVAAGTPVRVSATDLYVHAVTFNQINGQTGRIVVGNSAMNKTTLSGVFKELPIPTTNAIPAFPVSQVASQNAINLSQFYVDADVTGEKCLVTYMIA